MILVSGLINIKQFNLFYDYMLESNNNYVKLANSYYQMTNMLPYYYEDERLDEDEYNKLLENNDTYKYLIEDAYQDKELSKEEYNNIKNVVTDDYNKNYPGLYYKYEKSMIYYYIICNYVINTPIGIWPLILYCFLLAVPGDIALSILGAVVAKRIRPVVMQYLTDPKPIISSVSEETAK